MDFKKWADARVGNLNFADIQLTKISMFAFTLMVAKLWEPILSLEWYWYALVFVLTVARPLSRFYIK